MLVPARTYSWDNWMMITNFSVHIVLPTGSQCWPQSLCLNHEHMVTFVVVPGNSTIINLGNGDRGSIH